ncbi:MAG: TetR/AcrR family transcriptional regulator [Solirubrobacterales bacterium]|nr:TetR/AcrR family transcriptional regulator [Solirubrobacterales bacterium]
MTDSALTKPPRRSSKQTREHLLETARELFYWEGIHATGVDRVAAAAGVAPTTLYRLFDSKDELIAAYVEHDAAGYRDYITTATAPSVGTARERILALFDALIAIVGPENCRGCPFLMAISEFPDPEHPAHREAVAVKAWVRSRLLELCEALAADEPIGDPDALADQLALVVEGIYGSVQALGDQGPATRAHDAAVGLLAAASR